MSTMKAPLATGAAYQKLRAAGGGGGSGVCVCMGDSLTHGFSSADWVTAAEARLPHMDWVNEGLLGDMAYHLSRRCEIVLQLQPQLICVLIGTNDVIASLSPAYTDWYAANTSPPKLPKDWRDQADIFPALANYEKHVGELL